jgi:predicted secreted hydrolase
MRGNIQRIGIIVAIGLGVLIFSVFWPEQKEGGLGEIGANAEFLAVSSMDLDQYARAIEPYAWSFPADHGAHPDFQTEWWYYTGNLATETERRFGFQFTVFRRAITPDVVGTDSEWRTNQLYMAHFTITDVDKKLFYQSQRFSRGSAGLAGATTDPRYRVWLEDWEILAQDDDALFTTISAGSDEVAIHLNLEQIKAPALQGEQGLSPKSGEVGNASYYYSLSRLLTDGTITIEGVDYAVSGSTWMDHEFSTSALGPQAQGWDWFGLHLDDNRELMLGQIRLINGGIEPAFGGLLIDSDGNTRYLAAADFTFEVLETWVSPHTGTEYPAGWFFTVEVGESKPLELTLTPLISDQELIEGTIIYWEGAVRITGDVTGYGYAELTGYQDVLRVRF